MKDSAQFSRYLPPILLAAVAASQIVLAWTKDLTAWKGGGFGMFSTLDHGAYRGVDVVVDGTDRSEEIEIPPSLETAAARAAAFPADWLLRELAEGVVARERRYQRAVTRVTLTVWRADFDPATLHASERQLRTFTYVAPSDLRPAGGDDRNPR
jgi:hypothetical protein